MRVTKRAERLALPRFVAYYHYIGWMELWVSVSYWYIVGCEFSVDSILGVDRRVKIRQPGGDALQILDFVLVGVRRRLRQTLSLS